uniref:Uncharacterized protein n=1 Tax=Octopus bimaculoides TaxID=37653 RepID=A0A0L8I0L9_OCTBM
MNIQFLEVEATNLHSACLQHYSFVLELFFRIVTFVVCSNVWKYLDFQFFNGGSHIATREVVQTTFRILREFSISNVK